VALAVIAAGAAGCHKTRALPLSVAVCGELCGETDRSPTSYAGLDCAIAVRLRLVRAQGGATLAERCVPLAGGSSDPSAPRLSDLFDTGAGAAAHPVDLGRMPSVPFWAEVSLYAPGSQPCKEAQPLLAAGRSGVVAPESSDTIHVPLGCRDACETHGNVQVQLQSLEDRTPLDATPASLGLGEIFPYEIFTATAGVCTAPPLTAHRGFYRPFTTQQTDANLDGTWGVDHSAFDGCVAIASEVGGGRQLSCLSDANTSRSTLVGYVLDDLHLSAVRDFNRSVHAQNGALVVRLIDPDSGDENDSALDAHVTYTLEASTNEAEYPQDDSWQVTPGASGGTTGEGLGVAIFADAPAGPYEVRFSDDAVVTVNAGGSDDPDVVTTVLVLHP
jgi:hypothetical protein